VQKPGVKTRLRIWVVRCRNPESKPDSGFGSKAALKVVRCRNPESKPDSGFTDKVAVRHEGVGNSLRTFKDFVTRPQNKRVRNNRGFEMR